MDALSTRRPALNIVLVDDDEAHARNVRRAFSKSGIDHPVFVASDGREALELLKNGEVPRARRLVLLDINMPRMSGMEFLRALRDDPELKCTPVVVLTTSEDARDLLEAYRLNVAGYLLKPQSFDGFLELMQALNCYWAHAELV